MSYKEEIQTGSRIRIEINRTKLTPESNGHDSAPKTSADQATEHIECYFRIRMALVHPNSCECTKSELDLFEVPPTQTSVVCG